MTHPVDKFPDPEETLKSNRYVDALRLALKHDLAILADIVGALGIPALILMILDWVDVHKVMGMSPQKFAWSVGLAPFVILTSVASIVWIADNRRRAMVLAQRLLIERDEHAKEMKRKSEEYYSALAEARQHNAREAHKLASDAMSHVFGYRLKLRRHSFTLHPDGSASCYDIIVFECNRRSMGAWSRTVISDTTHDFQGCRNIRINNNVECTVSRDAAFDTGTRRAFNEHFTFRPTIHSGLGEVQLSYEETLPIGSFVREYTPGDTKAIEKGFDFASAFVLEPTARLEIVVDFRDFEVGIVDADAVYSAAEQPLLRETVEARERLRETTPDGHRTATLAIDYPVLGATYRITWKLRPKAEGPTDLTNKVDDATKTPGIFLAGR